jgi:ectoine hydroxylase-related dioxygenase (phytanoyl-CoA dioxygenase family)
MKMTETQIREFHENGYFIARGLFDAEEMKYLLEVGRADSTFADAGGGEDAAGRLSRISLENYAVDDIYSLLVCSRRIVDNMEILLGDEVYHFHHKMMLKEPRVGGAWEWHQDYGYWYMHQKCLWPDMASCAIAVDRASKENGCMQVLKGSHLCGRIEHGQTGGQTGADMERVNALLERQEPVYAEMDPGDGLFFHANTLHRSDENLSEYPRWTLIGCYNTKYNSPLNEQGGHPQYHFLEKIDDEDIKPRAKQYWEQTEVAKPEAAS